MGIGKHIKTLTGSFSAGRDIAKLIPEVKKITSGFSRAEMQDALDDDDNNGEKIRALASNIYSKLPVAIKKKLNEENFIQEMIKNKSKLLSNKSNKKKIKRIKQKNKK